jgi:putative ATPase
MADAERLRHLGRRTIVFIDEIHRFNKAQQDAFLPYVERGDIVLIGATTENPSFEVIAALLSRSRVYALRALTAEEIVGLLQRALADSPSTPARKAGLASSFSMTSGTRKKAGSRVKREILAPLEIVAVLHGKRNVKRLLSRRLTRG